MQTLSDAPTMTATLPRIQDPQAALLASLMVDHAWGLARAAQSSNLQEVCFGLGEYYSALAEGKTPPKGVTGLLPLLLRELRAELRERHAKPVDLKVLLAAQLVWDVPALGPRGLRAAQKAWLRVWRRQAGAAAHLRSLQA